MRLGRLAVICVVFVFLSSVSSAQTMSLPGQFAVSETGAATYMIPIEVPPGVAGMEPKLALIYNSQSGNGLLGMGWSLSGLSAITRCPRTMVQDGVRGGINYDLNDRYCLDGQRLILVSGTEGGNGTEYRTERDSFNKIVAYTDPAITGGAAKFFVQTKAGLSMEYGYTEDSRIKAQGKTVVREWAVNKIVDSKESYIDFIYTNDLVNGFYYPLEISYAGITRVGVNTVRFSYEGRLDAPVQYRAGSALRVAERVKKIDIVQDGNIKTSYNLLYETSFPARYSLLNSLAKCTGSICNPAVSVSWTKRPEIPPLFAPANVYQSFVTPATGWFTPTMHSRVWPEDINGDGLLDVIAIDSAGVHWQLNTGSGFSAEQIQPSAFVTSQGWFATSIHGRVWLTDINGDGLPDFVGIDSAGLHWQLNTGNGFSAEQTQPSAFVTSQGWFATSIHERVWLTDINGDGLPDFVGIDSAGVHWQLNTGSGFSAEHVQPSAFVTSQGWFATSIHERVWLTDINGDGLPDFIGIDSAGVHWQLNTGSGFSSKQFQSSAFITSQGWFATSIRNRVWLTDINGDGLPDFVGIDSVGVHWQLNTGNGFTAEVVQPSSFVTSQGWFVTSLHGRVWLTDINGDGLPDFIGIDNTGVHWQLNTGDGFAAGQSQSSGFLTSNGWFTQSIGNRVWILDANGDGRPDIVGIDSSGFVFESSIPAGNERLYDTVEIISNFGHVTSFHYSSLVNNAVYDKDVASNYPRQALEFPMYVISSTRESDGSGGMRQTSYRYGNAIAELGTGRGFLGFQWVQSEDVSTGLVSRTWYRQDWPFVGLVDKVERGTSVANRS
ncbi:MAG: FG-GAP-like repeat-containing protein, partial [Pseudomonadota bacterium]